MTKIDLRKQIKRELQKQGISIPKIARKLECNPQTLYNYLSGRKALGANLMQKMLNELGGRLEF